MKIVRTIVPVGFGAFCIERFFSEASGENNFVVVYDCGKGKRSSTSEKFKRIIDSELGACGKSVDFLFLSHFDNDHINGLSHLIDTGLVDKVDTTVFLPLLQVHHIYLYEYINNLHFFDTVRILKQHGIKIVFVKPDGQIGENDVIQEFDGGLDFVYSNSCQICASYSNFHPSSSGKPLWKYIPFYLQDNGIYDEFLAYIQYKFEPQVFQDFLNWPLEMKNWLKKRYINFRYSRGLYDDSVSPINMNAMLLISDKTENAQIIGRSIKMADLCDPSMHQLNQIGCSALYTSDVGLNSDQYFWKVRWAIRNYIDGGMAGLFQIPHHASSHCYNMNTFTDMPFEMAFCNCKRYSRNPIYCVRYEKDALHSRKSYAIVDTHRFEEEILVQ